MSIEQTDKDNCEAAYLKFSGHVMGLERALWEWGSSNPRSRFIHASLGHEAAAFHTTRVITPEQALWSLYYRSHAWLLALGVALEDIVAEISGSRLGPLEGRAGPMHLLLHPGIVDCNSIVGAQIPIAVGAAMANRNRGKPTVCSLGDGATNTGVFFEALNIASLYRVPILFVVEDNGVAMDTPYSQTSNSPIRAKFELFSIPFFFTQSRNHGSSLQVMQDASALVVKGPVAVCFAGSRKGAHVLSFQSDFAELAVGDTEVPIYREAMLETYRECTNLLGLRPAPYEER